MHTRTKRLLATFVAGCALAFAVMAIQELRRPPPLPVEKTESLLARGDALLRQWESIKARDSIDYDELINVRMRLEIVPAKDPQRAEASRLNAALTPARDYFADRSIKETRRKAEERVVARSVMIAGPVPKREDFASDLERDYLKRGMDMRVRAEDTDKTTLKMTHILMGRPLVYQFTNDSDFIDVLYRFGFGKLIMSNGYGQSWSCTVTDFKMCRVSDL